MPNSTTLIDAWETGRTRPLPRALLLAVAGSLLIAACAQLLVPMWPVPMTMQTFAVLLIGLSYGPRLGSATVALYLGQGALGLPVFAGGAGGIAQLLGPTGGYLAGFVAAAALVGWMAQQGWSRPVLRVFLAMLAGSAVIYAFGAAWLSTLVGLDRALAVGVLPFLLGDAVKAALAAVLLPLAWRASRPTR